MDKNLNDGIKVEAKVSKDIIDNLSTDIVQKYDQKFSKIEKNGLSFYSTLTVLACLTAMFLPNSRFESYLNEKFVTFVEFNSRELLGQSAKLSPKIKVLVKDDSTVSYIGKPFLSTTDWADLLEFIGKHKPKVIYIDKIFPFIDPNSEEVVKRIEKIGIPIYVGASIHRQKISTRHNLDMSDNIYQPQNYLDKSIEDGEVRSFLKWSKLFARKDSQHIYSRHSDYGNIFESANISYFSQRYIHPLVNVKVNDDDYALLPHLGIVGANQISVYPDRILVNGNDIGISNQKVLINYVNPEKILTQAKPIQNILSRIQEEKETRTYTSYNEFLKPGDSVFIVPSFFTGATDFKPTPYGDQFGALIPMSVLNSSIGGGWIKEVNSPFYLFGVIIITSLAAAILLPLFAWAFLTIFNLFIIAIGIYAFSYHDLAMPWLMSSILSILVGALTLAFKSKSEILKNKVVEEMKFETETIAQEKLLFEQNQRVLLKEKKEASIIASAFSPDPIPAWGSVKISGFHRCFDAASGDWFCFEKSTDGNYLHHIMCDITGHGVQAALIVSTCKAVLNTLKLNDPNIINRKDFSVKYLEMLNNILYDQGRSNHMTTFLAVTIEPAADKIHYLSCAHPPPILHRKHSDLHRPMILRMRHDPLGFLPSVKAKILTVDFHEGDKLVIYTDGIPINENFRVYKQFLESNPDNWSELPRALYKFIWSHIETKYGRAADDDVSLMIMERTEVKNLTCELPIDKNSVRKSS